MNPTPVWKASLPMYVFNREAVETFGHGLAKRLQAQDVRDVPAQLTWPDDCHSHWLEPDLLLSQACGYPLMTEQFGKVQLIGSVAYGVAGAMGCLCKSPIVVRQDADIDRLNDLHGKHWAYSDERSQSGYNSIRHTLAKTFGPQGGGGFAVRTRTGGHSASLNMVRAGEADFCALDCVTWAGVQHYHPEAAAGLRVVDWTESYPGLPLIASRHVAEPTLTALKRAWQQAMNDGGLKGARHALFMTGFVQTPWQAYERITEMAAVDFHLPTPASPAPSQRRHASPPVALR